MTLDRVARRTWREPVGFGGRVRWQGRSHQFIEDGHDFPIACWSGFYRRAALGDAPFQSGMGFGEDALFNLRFFTSADRAVAFTTTLLYIYEIREGSAIGTRSRRASRRSAACMLGLIEAIASVRDSEPRLSAGMSYLLRGQMVPLTSRVLSAGLTRGEFADACRRLEGAGALPYDGAGLTGHIMGAVYRYKWLYPVLWPLFKGIFEPFILPRISKG